MCSRDRVHEREKERERGGGSALSQTRWRARGHCTPPPFDQYCDTLRLFRRFIATSSPSGSPLFHLARRVSSMGRDFHDGSSGSRGFPLLGGELWLLVVWLNERRTMFHVSFGREKGKKRKRKWWLHRCEWLLISGKVVRTKLFVPRFRDTKYDRIYSSCSILRLFVPSYVFFNYFDRLVFLVG